MLQTLYKVQEVEKEDRNNKGPFRNILGPYEYDMIKYDDKEIWLFGENHNDIKIPTTVFNNYLDINTTTCEINKNVDNIDTITFERFLFALITENVRNKRYCDIFVELDIHLKIHTTIKFEYYSYTTLLKLNQMFNYMKCDSMKPHLKQHCMGYPYNRVHFSDYRSEQEVVRDGLTFSLLAVLSIICKDRPSTTTKILNKLPKDWITEYQEIVIKSANFADDILKFVSGISKINPLDLYLRDVKILYPTGPSRIGKQYFKLRKENPDIAKNVVSAVILQTTQIKEIFYRKREFNIDIELWEMDIPVMLRMFRKFDNESKLKIVYAGAYHTNMYKHVLQTLGASVIHSTVNILDMIYGKKLKKGKKEPYEEKFITLDDEAMTSLNKLLSPHQDINCFICSQPVIAACSHCNEKLCSEICFDKHKERHHDIKNFDIY
jgi:hypothetical protein